MRLIIAGSRDFNNYDFLEKEVLKFIKNVREEKEIVEIISGCARGADKLGEIFADKFSLTKHLMPADWKKYGRAAGMIRNEDMAKKGSHCICFWNRESTGTYNMIKTAKEYSLVVKVVHY